MYGKDKRFTQATFSICKIRVFVKSSENLEFWNILLKCIRFVAGLQIRIHIVLGSRILIPTEVKFRRFEGQIGAVEGRRRSQWRRKMEPWQVCRPVVADSHHFDQQDPQSCLVGNRIFVLPYIQIGVYCVLIYLLEETYYEMRSRFICKISKNQM